MPNWLDLSVTSMTNNNSINLMFVTDLGIVSNESY